MAKIDFSIITDEECKSHIKKYQRNKYKQGMNSRGYDDPYINSRLILKKFKGIDFEKSELFLQEIQQENNKYSPYIELGIEPLKKK